MDGSFSLGGCCAAARKPNRRASAPRQSGFVCRPAERRAAERPIKPALWARAARNLAINQRPNALDSLFLLFAGAAVGRLLLYLLLSLSLLSLLLLLKTFPRRRLEFIHQSRGEIRYLSRGRARARRLELARHAAGRPAETDRSEAQVHHDKRREESSEERFPSRRTSADQFASARLGSPATRQFVFGERRAADGGLRPRANFAAGRH